MSEVGASVLVEADSPLPDDFILILPAEGLQARAELVWQAGTRAGVQFTLDADD